MIIKKYQFCCGLFTRREGNPNSKRFKLALAHFYLLFLRDVFTKHPDRVAIARGLP